MGEKIELTLTPRDVHGKKVATLRKRGLVPAVVYGANQAPELFVAPMMAMTKMYKMAGKHHPVQLTVDNKHLMAMIATIDMDPVKHTLRHVAFHAVRSNETVTAEIPIVVRGEGETPAEKAGLVLLKTVETIEVTGLPGDLPDEVELDGERLISAGDRLTVADLVLPKGITAKTESDQVLVSVYEPSAMIAAEEEEEAVAAQEAAAQAAEEAE